jgi:type II secretory pathway component PulM
MSKVLAHPFQVGFSDSMSLVLLCGGAIMLVAFLILLLMPPVELRTTSASAAARAEDNVARNAAVDGPAPDEGAHRAPVEVVVGEPAGNEDGGRHAGATAADEVKDPR